KWMAPASSAPGSSSEGKMRAAKARRAAASVEVRIWKDCDPSAASRAHAETAAARAGCVQSQKPPRARDEAPMKARRSDESDMVGVRRMGGTGENGIYDTPEHGGAPASLPGNCTRLDEARRPA